MENKQVIKVMCGIAVVVSATFSIQLMCGQVSGIFNKALAACITIVLEFCKCYFFYVAVIDTKCNKYIRCVLFSVSLGLFCVSILASLSFLNNETNVLKNITIQQSEEFKAKQNNIKSQEALISSIQGTIDTLKQQSDENLKRNFITRNQEVISQIDEKTKELNAATSHLQEIQSEKVTEVKNVRGYTAFLSSIAAWMNEQPERKDKPISVETLETWVFSFISIIFEIVALLLFYLSQSKSYAVQSVQATISNAPGQDIINETALKQLVERYKHFPGEVMEIDVDKKKESPIGFKFDSNLCSAELLSYSKYIEYLEFILGNKLSGNRSPGANKIADGTSLTLTEVRSIKDLLKDLRILEVDHGEKNTKILVNDLQEAVDILNPLFKVKA